MEEKIIRYSDFGAVGDGFADDYLAILAAHEAANKIGAKVIADEGMRYYMGAHDVTIPIMTDVDWTGATIIIDDSKIKIEDKARTTSVFTVLPSLKRFNIDLKSVKKGAKKLDVAPGVPCMIHLEDDNHRVYVRYGGNANNGEPLRELIISDADGNIDENTPPVLNYSELTSCFCIPIDEKPITIQGGYFITVLNVAFPKQWLAYDRNIEIKRSNTTIKNIVHKNVGDNPFRAATTGFIHASFCNNILIKDITFSSEQRNFFKNAKGQTVLIGSYETGATECNNITWENCKRVLNLDTEGNKCTSGCMGTNRMKNVKYYNNENMTFDAHTGLYNLHIKGGIIVAAGIQGAGTAILEDLTMCTPYVMHFKMDYGSGWDGDFIIKNVKLEPAEVLDEYNIFKAWWVNHDFGYRVTMPRNLYIENLTVPDNKPIALVTNGDNYDDITKEVLADGTINKNPIVPTKKLTVKSKGLNFRLNDGKLYEYIDTDIDI